MRVAVLGAGGTIAPAIVRDLSESEEVTAMRLLDLDLRRAEEVAMEHGGGKAQARRADATGDLAEQLAGTEVLVNSAAYRINLAAMRACLDAGCHYMDLGGLYHVTAEQLELSGKFEQAGLLALLGIGSAPGKTNLLAARAVRELHGSPSSISVLAAGRDLDPPDGLSFPYAVRTLLDEVTMPPMALVDGRARELEPLQAGPTADFGEPIGEGETIFTLHSEVLTFGDSFGCPNVTFALSLSPKVLESLEKLRGASEERIAEAARSASPPSANTVSVHIVEVTGADTVVRARSVTPPRESWGLGGGIVSTATPAAAAVRLLARGSIERRGALPPESCIDPEEMFGELENRGVRFDFSSAPAEGGEALESKVAR
jgi:saccharopine dehydrogenase-like NADP-dependent oxidoreductase